MQLFVEIDFCKTQKVKLKSACVNLRSSLKHRDVLFIYLFIWAGAVEVWGGGCLCVFLPHHILQDVLFPWPIPDWPYFNPSARRVRNPPLFIGPPTSHTTQFTSECPHRLSIPHANTTQPFHSFAHTRCWTAVA